jgi:hypothetical protein
MTVFCKAGGQTMGQTTGMTDGDNGDNRDDGDNRDNGDGKGSERRKPTALGWFSLLNPTSEVQSKLIFMGHQILSCHVPVVRSFFIFWKTLLSS